MRTPLLLLAAATAFAGNAAVAEPVSVEAMLAPQEEMRFEFPNSNHFVLAVRREGTAEGTGAFAGAAVTEFGWHDVNPPITGDPHGYLQITAPNGDIAILRWTVKAAFLAGEDGPTLSDAGYWELVTGTGQFEGKRGVGTLVLEPAGGPTNFVLEGEIGDAPAQPQVASPDGG